MRQLILLIVFFSFTNCYSPDFSIMEWDEYIEFVEELEQIQEELLREQRVENLLAALRIVESNNRFDAWGLDGEYGAYQFLRPTWEYYSYVFFGEVLDWRVVENQNKVARAKIEFLIDEEYNNQEIAAIWNSGSPDWEGRRGYNSNGTFYDVHRYVNNFIQTFEELENSTRKA